MRSVGTFDYVRNNYSAKQVSLQDTLQIRYFFFYQPDIPNGIISKYKPDRFLKPVGFTMCNKNEKNHLNPLICGKNLNFSSH